MHCAHDFVLAGVSSELSCNMLAIVVCVLLSTQLIQPTWFAVIYKIF